ncbi:MULTISPECIES: hypothetical protein [Aneurinibacillus]|jgi:hypothetical protein|uniref:Uncharacterized protein n=1 Tax=Aneurinibacillus danicus TaxID=267746 RepID=A0A511V742_9BACL|nr:MULTISPECIES: hypothetical protein [Aneurinibacillus]GEN34757.1 hypothetical protein ADA01nite_22170 [Aneurinibacillus danicus]
MKLTELQIEERLAGLFGRIGKTSGYFEEEDYCRSFLSHKKGRGVGERTLRQLEGSLLGERYT